MTELSIRFLAVEGSPYIEQAPAYCMSIVTIKPDVDKHPEPLKIVGLSVNGSPRKFRPVDDVTITTSPPIPFEGRTVEVRCLAPYEPLEALQRPQATYPLPTLRYGLQAPDNANGRPIHVR